MMIAQLTDVTERGEPVATLRASEARIYGRFGYGVATRGRTVRVRRSGRGWRDGTPIGGTVRLVARDTSLATVTAVHDAIALRRPGGMPRPPGLWHGGLARRIDDHEHVLVAVHTGPDGDDGFAVAGVDSGPDFTRRTLNVDDLYAADVEAAAGQWRFLLDLDLTGDIEAEMRPLDEPLELLLADPRDCAVTAQHDETWLRLVDVPAALAARRFPVGPPAAEAGLIRRAVPRPVRPCVRRSRRRHRNPGPPLRPRHTAGSAHLADRIGWIGGVGGVRTPDAHRER